MNAPFGPTVTLVSRTVTGVDTDGNDTYTTVETPVQAQAFDPGGSIEVLGDQDTVTTTPTLYLPPSVAVGSVDAVIVNGVTYEVDGSPSTYTNPFTGWTPGTVVKLRAVVG